MLNLSQITKRYKKQTILDDISITFDTGVSLLVGPSGAGKTTLLRLCSTAEKPSSGQMTWHGKALPQARKALRQSLGYAPQIVDLPGDLTGLEFMCHMAALKNYGGGAKAQAQELLEQLGLGESAGQPISVYSGGMRRRLIFAQALIGKPSLLICDEPTAELDHETARRVTDLIMQAAQTATVIVTTHMTDHFQSQGARTYRVADGKAAPQ